MTSYKIDPLKVCSLSFGRKFTCSWEVHDLFEEAATIIKKVEDKIANEIPPNTADPRHIELLIIADAQDELMNIMLEQYCKPACLSLASKMVEKIRNENED